MISLPEPETPKPRTLVKSASLEGNLLVSALRRYDSDFREIPVGDLEIDKYALWKRVTPNPYSYWMMLFYYQRKSPPVPNTLFTLTSLDDTTNNGIYKQFVKITGLEFSGAENPVHERFIQEYYPKVKLLNKLMGKIGRARINFPLIRTV